ncbi:MAG: endonuclease/exonuclease/phosphatase family protein [Phycisphaerales bacterium]
MPNGTIRFVLAFCASIMAVPLLARSGNSTQPEADDSALIELIEQAESTMRRFGQPEAPAKEAGTFRLTTYNIENLFDDVDDPALSGDNEDIDDTKPHHELLAAARAIREVDADVLCLQEVESREALDWFIENYISDLGYEHVISLDAGNARGIENAVLSRYPLSNPELWIGKELGGVHPDNYGPNAKNYYAGEPIAFRRSPLKVDVEIPSNDDAGSSWTLTLFVVHHKSGRYSGYWREAEAKNILKLAKAIEDEHPGRPVAILGDFNAQPSDESVKIYLRDGFNDLFANASAGDKSTITHESNRRIDLILLNEAAMGRFQAGSGFVYGTAARPHYIDWRDMPTFEGYASDHYPASVDLNAED